MSIATLRVGLVGLTAAALAGGLVGQAPLPEGVTIETHTAVVEGLQWLSANRAGDGSWRNAGADGGNPVAMTALAAMAFVASGSTPTRGRFYPEVRAAVDFLLNCSDSNTGLITHGDESVPMFGHGFATLLIGSIYGMEEDLHKQRRLKRVLDRAVSLTASAQSSAGGWIYYPGSNDDEGSVTITQMQALRACRMAGIVVDKRTVDRGVDYVKRCQNTDGGIRYKLNGSSSSRPAITAAGVAVFYNAGIYEDIDFVASALRFCAASIKVRTDTTGHHFYTHHYWSQALYQRGGPEWEAYYDSISSWLREQQRPSGCWQGDNVGPVYGTAVALTILQLPYALVPIYQR